MLFELINLFGNLVTIFAHSSILPVNNYVEYIPGNTNLIFSVPHDGSINLTSIPVRRNGCKDLAGVCIFPGSEDCDPDKICEADIVADLNAKVIARTVYDKYVESTGKYPHLIISHSTGQCWTPTDLLNKLHKAMMKLLQLMKHSMALSSMLMLLWVASLGFTLTSTATQISTDRTAQWLATFSTQRSSLLVILILRNKVFVPWLSELVCL